MWESPSMTHCVCDLVECRGAALLRVGSGCVLTGRVCVCACGCVCVCARVWDLFALLWERLRHARCCVRTSRAQISCSLPARSLPARRWRPQDRLWTPPSLVSGPHQPPRLPRPSLLLAALARRQHGALRGIGPPRQPASHCLPSPPDPQGQSCPRPQNHRAQL